MEQMFFISIPYAAFLMYLIIATIRTIAGGKNEFPNVIIIISEIVFTIVAPAIGFWRFDLFGHDLPFDKHHVISIILLVIISSASFWLAKLTFKNENPLLRILLSVGLLQGIFLCFITTVHFAGYIHMGILFPFFGFELLSPLIALFFLVKEFYFYNRIIINLDELLPYREQLGFIPLPLRILQLPALPRIMVYSSGVLILIFLEIMIAYPFGQDPDSIIQAFTHSTGFIFSKSYGS